jgi:hypothetical protein
LQTPNIASLVYQCGRRLCQLTEPDSPAVRAPVPGPTSAVLDAGGAASLGERCGFQCAGMGTQPLPNRDIEVSFLLRGPLLALQLVDSWRSTGILIWALLRKHEQ